MSKIVLESVAESTVGFEWYAVCVAPVLMEPNIEMDPGLRILLRCPPHEEAYLKAFDGKRVRVTIEVVEEPATTADTFSRGSGVLP